MKKNTNYFLMGIPKYHYWTKKSGANRATKFWAIFFNAYIKNIDKTITFLLNDIIDFVATTDQKKGTQKIQCSYWASCFLRFLVQFSVPRLFRMKDDNDRRSHVRGVFAKSANEADFILHSCNCVFCKVCHISTDWIKM